MAMPSKFGKRLRSAREERDLTQEQLGKMAGISALMVSHFETGTRQKPSIENLVKLSKALHVSTDYLLGRTDDKEPTGSPLEAAFRSESWEKTEDRMRFLEDLTRLWSERDKDRTK
jgi:transcriptional regulator with XRE-family HTH domain